MDKALFLTKLADLFEVDQDQFNEQFELDENNWDSMARLATIAVIDEMYNITVPTQQLAKCQSVEDLLNLVQANLAK